MAPKRQPTLSLPELVASSSDSSLKVTCLALARTSALEVLAAISLVLAVVKVSPG